MSRETREKMGEVARTARVLLEIILKEDSSPGIDAGAALLRNAISDFEEHLYGTVAAVIDLDNAEPECLTDPGSLATPGGFTVDEELEASVKMGDDEIPF